MVLYKAGSMGDMLLIKRNEILIQTLSKVMHTSLRRDKDDVCRENPSTEGSFLETNLNYFFIIKMSPTYLRGFL